MSEVQRRDVLVGTVGVAAAALTAVKPAKAGDPSFLNNVPDPVLSGAELPTFKFALEKSEGKVVGNSYGKEATVTQLPISKGIAGVSMRLEPGGLRALDRERGRTARSHPDWLQFRNLRNDRSVAMDRRQPGRRTGHQFRAAAGIIRQIPQSRCVSRRLRRP